MNGPDELRKLADEFDALPIPPPMVRRLRAAAVTWEELEKRFVEEVEWDNKRADKILAELEEKHDEVRALRERLEAAECPDVPTARALAVLIMTNKVPSPWRDTGTRLREIGKWLATIAGEKP